MKKNISKRTRKRSRRKSSFGQWWGNTQLTYCRPGSECANASTLSGRYPFYSDNSDWKPYYPIKSSAFGADQKQEDIQRDRDREHASASESESESEPEPKSEGDNFREDYANLSSIYNGTRKLPTYSDDYPTFLNEFQNKLSSERNMVGEINIGGCDMASDFNKKNNTIK